MKSPKFPITDDHIHIDPVNGRGLEAAKDFFRAGGTHMFLVSKPSWSLAVAPVLWCGLCRVFDETIRVAGFVADLELLSSRCWACTRRRSTGSLNACRLQKQRRS